VVARGKVIHHDRLEVGERLCRQRRQADLQMRLAVPVQDDDGDLDRGLHRETKDRSSLQMRGAASGDAWVSASRQACATLESASAASFITAWCSASAIAGADTPRTRRPKGASRKPKGPPATSKNATGVLRHAASSA